MGRNSIAKPKKKHKKGLTEDHKLIRKEVKLAVKENSRQLKADKDQIYRDIIECVAPIAFKEAVTFMIPILQMKNRDRFGHGKKRLKDIAADVLFSYECICDGYVTIGDIQDEMFKVTGERYEFDFDEMVEEMVEAARKKREERELAESDKQKKRA